MKMGVRKPNLKSRVKARTTGRIKRSVKSAIDPTYGKKGMGWVKDPKKAAYNAVYHRTTVGIGEDSQKRRSAEDTNVGTNNNSFSPGISYTQVSEPPKRTPMGSMILMLVGLLFLPVALICFFIRRLLGFQVLLVAFSALFFGAAIMEQRLQNRRSTFICGGICIVIAIILFLI